VQKFYFFAETIAGKKLLSKEKWHVDGFG